MQTEARKTVYLHIGAFKTGSTSIQEFVSTQHKAFASCGYFVPTSRVHHHLPASLIRDNSTIKATTKFKGTSQQIWKDVFDEIAATPLKKVVITTEIFSDLARTELRHLDAFFTSYLQRYFRDYTVKVVCYVRPVDRHLVSWYKERIKNTDMTRKFHEHVAWLYRQDSHHMFPTKYLDFFSDVFGKENMIVKKYDRESLLGGDSVSDFLHTIGADELIGMARHSSIRSNPSLENEQIDLKRALNRAGIKERGYNRHLSSMLIAAGREVGMASEKVTTGRPGAMLAARFRVILLNENLHQQNRLKKRIRRVNGKRTFVDAFIGQCTEAADSMAEYLRKLR